MNFKVGDKVRVIGKRNTASEDHFGEEFTINTIATNDHFNEEYVMAKEFHSNGIWVSDLELVIPQVTKQVTVRVKSGNTIVYHTTNTRRKLIVISGKRTIDDLDNLITALQQLKEEL